MIETPPEFYLQASVSKTRFTPQTPDSEDVGIMDYRRVEIEAIRAFVLGSMDILIMGGFSGTGKTYTLKHLLSDVETKYVDTHARSRDLVTAEQLAEDITANANKTASQARALIMDESFGLLWNAKKGEFYPHAKELLRILLETHNKLILVGGNIQFTSDEQTDIMEQACPKTAATQKQPFQVKTLNTKQTADLIQRGGLWFATPPTTDPKKLLPREFAETLAPAITPHLRLPRLVHSIASSILFHDEEIMNQTLTASISVELITKDLLTPGRKKDLHALSGLTIPKWTNEIYRPILNLMHGQAPKEVIKKAVLQQVLLLAEHHTEIQEAARLLADHPLTNQS